MMQSPTPYSKVIPSELLGASPTIQAAVAWLEHIAATLLRKNVEYGDSAAQPMRIFSSASPIEQVLVRIDDKLSRIARGKGGNEDTLGDLVGYLAILHALENQPIAVKVTGRVYDFTDELIGHTTETVQG